MKPWWTEARQMRNHGISIGQIARTLGKSRHGVRYATDAAYRERETARQREIWEEVKHMPEVREAQREAARKAHQRRYGIDKEYTLRKKQISRAHKKAKPA